MSVQAVDPLTPQRVRKLRRIRCHVLLRASTWTYATTTSAASGRVLPEQRRDSSGSGSSILRSPSQAKSFARRHPSRDSRTLYCPVISYSRLSRACLGHPLSKALTLSVPVPSDCFALFIAACCFDGLCGTDSGHHFDSYILSHLP
jgi:hypothetical protein